MGAPVALWNLNLGPSFTIRRDMWVCWCTSTALISSLAVAPAASILFGRVPVTDGNGNKETHVGSRLVHV